MHNNFFESIDNYKTSKLDVSSGKKGIERESLRTNNENLSTTTHPLGLGLPILNKYITTDYSESLLELVTGPYQRTQDVLKELENITYFTQKHLGSEILWASSMPCILPADKLIPIAKYGDSESAKFKEIYRLGLGVRYSRTMQSISGIHYNYSLPETILETFADKNAAYLHLIRNFRRFSWLLNYLFGSTPVIDESFLNNIKTNLKLVKISDRTFTIPNATTLRMSELGYISSAQSSITPCYNHLTNYIKNIQDALNTSYPEYEKLGLFDEFGNQQQLNTNILQIENEYYTSIRPKQNILSGERLINALKVKGIGYVEVRCLDVNPFVALGINQDCMDFLEIFLIYCTLIDSPFLSTEACIETKNNFCRVANDGRSADLQLCFAGENIHIKDLANRIFQGLYQTAHIINKPSSLIDKYFALIADVKLTPSAQIIEFLQHNNMSFVDYTQEQSLKNKVIINNFAIDDDMQKQLLNEANKK